MKKKGEKDKPSVVKIDSEILDRVEEFISKKENKLKFVNKKQLIDIAVFEFLERNNKNDKT